MDHEGSGLKQVADELIVTRPCRSRRAECKGGLAEEAAALDSGGQGVRGVDTTQLTCS